MRALYVAGVIAFVTTTACAAEPRPLREGGRFIKSETCDRLIAEMARTGNHRPFMDQCWMAGVPLPKPRPRTSLTTLAPEGVEFGGADCGLLHSRNASLEDSSWDGYVSQCMKPIWVLNVPLPRPHPLRTR